ncbi:hypothetical protein Syun_029334 [Stephania yunnanensis]|uniref:Methylcrotonoyl-CoA carboxylase subunit alpha BT domain-containing protein n=1 Tax=Stephania yunnanensis TaxID=152371 RepID=A0AAP0HLA1_9MAGN
MEHFMRESPLAISENEDEDFILRLEFAQLSSHTMQLKESGSWGFDSKLPEEPELTGEVGSGEEIGSHVSFAVENYDKFVDTLKEKGIRFLEFSIGERRQGFFSDPDDQCKPLQQMTAFVQVKIVLLFIADNSSSRHEVKVTPLDQNDFRTEIDGLSININLAVYTKDRTKHIHVLHGKHHHHFRESKKIHLPRDDDSNHGPSFEMAFHPLGTVVDPMAGLVHVVKAPRSDYVHQLKVNTGQQVFDDNVHFVIKIASPLDV